MANFQYSIVRFMRNPLRDTARNVGCVVFEEKTGDIKIALYEKVREVQPFMDDMRMFFKGVDALRASSRRTMSKSMDLVAERSLNHIKVTKVRTLEAETLEDAAAIVYKRFIQPVVEENPNIDTPMGSV